MRVVTLSLAALLVLTGCGGEGGGPVEPDPPAPTGSVRVQVRDDANAALAGIPVELRQDTTSLAAVTGATGLATFDDVSVGSAIVTVAVPDGYRAPASSQSVTITEGNTSGATFQLTLEAGTISVTVRDSSGGFVPDVRVALSTVPQRVAVTSGIGYASFTRVPAGSVTVTVADTALGSFAATTLVDVTVNATSAVDVRTPRLTRGAWYDAPALPSSRASLAAVQYGDTIYVVGGSGTGGAPLEVLKLDGATWVGETTLAQGLNAPAAAVVGDELFVIGGFVGTGNTPSAAVRIYDFATKEWSSGAPMPTPRGGIQAAVLNGRIHVVGGGNASSTVAAHEAYDPATNTWASLQPLPSSRGNPALAVFEGRLYAIGGASGGSVFTDVDVFDPVTGSWNDGPAVPGGRVAARAVVYRDALYVFGGELTFTGARDDVFRLSAAGDAWQRMTRMPTGRSYAAAALLDDGVYLIGGSVAQATEHGDAGIAGVVRYVLP